MVQSRLEEEQSKGEQAWAGGYYNAGRGGRDLFAKPGEECGIFGAANHDEASFLNYYGLHALQHRGQESCGICSTDGKKFRHRRGMGLVKEVFDQEALTAIGGFAAIGHVRYSTSGESQIGNAQPLIFRYRGGELAIATNGTITNAGKLRHELEEEGSIFQTTSDTEVLAHLIARSREETLEGAVAQALRKLRGAYAFLILTNEGMIAALDPNGFRPFVMGKLGKATVFASESCAFDAVGAELVRDVRPGEMIVIDRQGLRERSFLTPRRRGICTMEYIYFARPDSDIDGLNIHSARKRLGRQLARESLVDADLVTGVPDSSISAAIGYAEETGIPYELGLIKNRYLGRTFIQPSQELREQGVKMKLSAVRSVVVGKRVIMVDDSIVRGTTSLRIVKLLREAGAKEVHVRISSPPFRNPCFFGIDTPRREDLIAATHSVEEIRARIGADTLEFLSPRGLVEAIGRPETGEPDRGHCLGCFSNEYPAYVDPEEFPDAATMKVGESGGGEEVEVVIEEMQ